LLADNINNFNFKVYEDTNNLLLGHNSGNKSLLDIALLQKKIDDILLGRVRDSSSNMKKITKFGSLRRPQSNKKSSLFKPHLNDLIQLLSDILCTEVELEIVQLKYPYHDSNIFAQYLGMKARKLTYGRIKNRIIKKIPVSLSNINSKTKNKNFVFKGGKKMSVLSAFKFGVGTKSYSESYVEKGTQSVTSNFGLRLQERDVQPLKHKIAKPLVSVNSSNLSGKVAQLYSNKKFGNNIIKVTNSNLVSTSKVKILKKGNIRNGTVNINLHKASILTLTQRQGNDKKLEQARLNKKRQLIASRLTGIKVRIAGRLARQRVVPKRTVKTAYKGAISRSVNNLVESATFTDKNKKGAFSIRV
jgi:hypothetical protein